ncbi:MAG: M16 family metallopeptidase [Rhodospirillaceae bacterium]
MRRFASLLPAVLLLGAFLLPSGPANAIEVQKVTSPSGISAYLVEDPSLPVISITAYFKAGGIYDPPGKGGLANMASALIDEGSGDLDSQAFQDKLADLAIELRFDAGRDGFSMDLRTTTERLEEAITLSHGALTAPRFDAEPVERIRSQLLARLRQDATDPGAQASRAFYKAVFGDHPYGRPRDGTPESVAAITRDDLVTFAQTRLYREGLSIGVAGDITAEALGLVLDQLFADLPAGPPAGEAPIPDPTPSFPGGVQVIDADIPQSQALFGHAGILRSDPDWQAAHAINYILGGGGFVSRLMTEVREKRGLAYSVYSYLLPLDQTGLWIGGVATQNARLKESLDTIAAEWTRMASDGPTEQELADAKTYLTGSWPLRFTSSGRIAGMLASMMEHDLPTDYIDTRNSEIEALTIEQLRAVAQRLLDPEALTTVVVGRPDGV